MTPIAPEIFKAYDIRGIVDRTLTEDGAQAIGRALGTMGAQRDVSSAVKLEFPTHGGHVGFVTGPFPGHIDWLPQRLLHFFDHSQ